MAKEAVSPVERHIEKGVLAIAVLFFVGGVVKYLISSPNTVTQGAREVGPAEIYQMVSEQAVRLRTNIQNHRVDVEKPSAPDRSDPVLAVAALRSPVPFSARVPKIKTEEIGNIELVKVVPPGKPVVAIGRSGAVLEPSMPITAMPEDPYRDYWTKWNEIGGEDESYLMAVNWVTVAAAIDVEAQQQAALELGYPPGRAVPYFVGAEIQRRERRWDGTYEKWAAVKTYAPLALPELPYLEIEEIDGNQMIPDDMRRKINRFFKVIENTDHLIELMRPMPPPVAYGAWWGHDALSKALGMDLMRLDDELWYGEEEGNCPLWDRYPRPPKDRDNRPDPNDPEFRERTVNEELDKLERWLAQGCFKAVVDRVDDLRRGPSLTWFNERQHRRFEDIADRASALLVQKQNKLKDLEKQGLTPPPRELSRTQVLWVHDTLPESVVSGKTYQYRMRALLYNNFAGAAGELKNPKDAEIVLLESDWSAPSDDVPVPYDSKFFLVGKKERDRLGKIDVFKWHEGSWTKTAFMVTVGDSIGDKKTVKLGRDKKRTRVDFSTGATAVDIDFNRPYRPRKARRGVITLGDAKPTVSLVYLDSAGELHERLLDVDKRTAEYKMMKEEVARASKPAPGQP